jgi:myo-inositol 2-dehydrogenase/D-chiro-inositol 1-dehydrogenase
MGDVRTPGQPSKPVAHRKLNVGVVGIGRVGQSHALNFLHKVPRANLLCACSPKDSDIVWADEHLVPYGVRVCRTFEEMIDTPQLEAVIIASATSLHMEHTIAALDRGIHVLCEKPVCTSVDEVSHCSDC